MKIIAYLSGRGSGDTMSNRQSLIGNTNKAGIGRNITSNITPERGRDRDNTSVRFRGRGRIKGRSKENVINKVSK